MRIRTENAKYEGEKGAALVIAIFSILLVTAISFALVSSSIVSQDIATGTRQGNEAYYISEAGLNHALAIMKPMSPSNYTSILQAGDGAANTCDELSTQPASVTAIPAAGLTLGNGKYQVCISDDDADSDGNPNADSNGILVVRSIGSGSDGSTASSEAIIKNVTAPAMPGFLAVGDAKIRSALKVYGTNSAIQVDRDIIGSPVCSESGPISIGTNGSKTSFGSLFIGAACTTPGTVGTTIKINAPMVAPPIYDITWMRANLRSRADYVFKADGKIYKQILGVQTALTSAEITALGFGPYTLASHLTWSYNSPIAPPNGTMYYEGTSVDLNHGDATKTIRSTLIAEGHVQVEDSQNMEPSLPGWAMLAGNDIAIVADVSMGNSSNPGLVYAYGQLEFSNKCNIYGGAVGANFYQANGTYGGDPDDVGGSNLAKGTDGAIDVANQVNIWTSGAGSGGSVMQVISRREVRN